MKTFKGQQTSRRLVATGYYSSTAKDRNKIAAICLGIFGIFCSILKPLFKDLSRNPVWERLVWNMPMSIKLMFTFWCKTSTIIIRDLFQIDSVYFKASLV